MSQYSSTIIVTGGAGLFGKGIESHILLNKEKHANERWIFLNSKHGDLRKLEDTRKIFQEFKPTHVIHLAAMVGGLYKNMARKLEFFRDNSAMNDNILLCCSEYKVKKCVSCLSTCIFPDKITYPIDETMIHLGPPHPSNEGYAYAKRMLDVLNRCWNEKEGPEGCKFLSVIPTNIYGPHDNYHLEDSHVIPGLIHKCYLAKKKGEPFVVFGTGKPLRQFIYSEDLGALIVWVLEKYNDISSPIILSVGEQEEVSIADVAQLVADAMGYTSGLKFDTTKSDGQFKKTASNKKLMGLNPTFKFTPIQEGIKKSVDWFVQNYDSARK